jgi:hypothetical protein
VDDSPLQALPPSTIMISLGGSSQPHPPYYLFFP